MCTDQISFMHSSADGHLHWLCNLPFVKDSTINLIVVCESLSGNYPSVQLYYTMVLFLFLYFYFQKLQDFLRVAGPGYCLSLNCSLGNRWWGRACYEFESLSSLSAYKSQLQLVTSNEATDPGLVSHCFSEIL